MRRVICALSTAGALHVVRDVRKWTAAICKVIVGRRSVAGMSDGTSVAAIARVLAANAYLRAHAHAHPFSFLVSPTLLRARGSLCIV